MRTISVRFRRRHGPFLAVRAIVRCLLFLARLPSLRLAIRRRRPQIQALMKALVIRSVSIEVAR